jgi:hypothetical protein
MLAPASALCQLFAPGRRYSWQKLSFRAGVVGRQRAIEIEQRVDGDLVRSADAVAESAARGEKQSPTAWYSARQTQFSQLSRIRTVGRGSAGEFCKEIGEAPAAGGGPSNTRSRCPGYRITSRLLSGRVINPVRHDNRRDSMSSLKGQENSTPIDLVTDSFLVFDGQR